MLATSTATLASLADYPAHLDGFERDFTLSRHLLIAIESFIRRAAAALDEHQMVLLLLRVSLQLELLSEGVLLGSGAWNRVPQGARRRSLSMLQVGGVVCH